FSFISLSFFIYALILYDVSPGYLVVPRLPFRIEYRPEESGQHNGRRDKIAEPSQKRVPYPDVSPLVVYEPYAHKHLAYSLPAESMKENKVCGGEKKKNRV